jgi:hypothetical protein
MKAEGCNHCSDEIGCLTVYEHIPTTDPLGCMRFTSEYSITHSGLIYSVDWLLADYQPSTNDAPSCGLWLQAMAPGGPEDTPEEREKALIVLMAALREQYAIKERET